MTSRTAAARYARALLDVATAERVDVDAVAAELDQLGAFLRAQPVLERVLLNPAVPSPRKRAAMEAITARAGVTAPLAKLLALLADRDRLALLPDIAAVFHEQLAERRNIVRAEVVSAEPLSAERVGAIEQKLAAVTGKQVTLTARVDPSLIGGVVARVGGTVYDASIATQLKRIRERLIS